MPVKKTEEDTYEVSGFLQSMPDISCVIRFESDRARVVERTGYTHDRIWDQRALQAVQSYLLQGLVD